MAFLADCLFYWNSLTSWRSCRTGRKETASETLLKSAETPANPVEDGPGKDG